MNAEFSSLINNVFDHYIKRAVAIYGFDSKIDLLFNLKGHYIIGQCRKLSRKHYLIRLHQPLIEHYSEIYLHDVLPHELAHAIAIERYKNRIKPHGKEWREILANLENKIIPRNERPTYKLLTAKRKLSRFSYICACAKHIHHLSAIRHNRIARGTHIYSCKICKLPLIDKNKV